MNWRQWMRQIGAVLRLELKKALFSRRAWWIYLLAAAPVVLCGAHALVMTQKRAWHGMAEDNIAFAAIYHIFYLRLGIFFGCVGIFMNLFRGEVLDKTLHYYLLAPIRREVLVVGKYLAGLAAAGAYFILSTAASCLLISSHFGEAYRDFLLRGPGLQHLGWYLTVTALAVIGYGGVFLLMGLLFRNPMIPAGLVMVWETNNWLLPAAAQKVSVIFYLTNLTPVPVPPKGPLAILAVTPDPVSAWLAIPGLLLVALTLVVLAALKARRLQISYAD
ncbi:MAG: ABC transporter permease [Acidobacteria bacterium]|nr:ABC transporter permease [Acidobacteriota bacterium]